MASLSKIIIIGNVGRDPELKMTASGKAVCEFSVAVNRGKGDQQETDWYRVSCWGTQAENAQNYITKGRLIYIEGRFQPREWTTREGERRLSLEISANDFRLLDRRDRDEQAADAPVTTPVPDESRAFDPDEIPF